MMRVPTEKRTAWRSHRFGLSGLLALALLLMPLLPDLAHAQNDIKPVLQKFQYYRYGQISLYQLRPPNLSKVKELLQTDETDEAGSEAMNKLDAQMQRTIVSAVQRGGRNLQGALDQLRRQGITLTTDIQAAIEYEVSKTVSVRRIEDVYLVTTRAKLNETPTIIALIQSSRGSENLETNLRSVPPTDIMTIDELKARSLDSSYGADNLYDYVENAIVQGAVSNVTAEAQGLGLTTLYPKVYGIARTLERNPADISPEDIQKYLRISAGEPQDFYRKELLVVGLDIISYRHYEDPYYDPYYTEENAGETDADADPNAAQANQLPVDPYNGYLPSYGVELRYGIDEINYPSLWSERLSLNAIWSNVSLGVILPTGGWSSLSDNIGADRRLTHGGFGLNGRLDFPFKVIPKSGLFNVSFGYVFGDAEQATYKDRVTDVNDIDYNLASLGEDYFIRFNAQALYTFAVNIDKDHMFRFGIGGTAYAVETWGFREDQNEDFEDILLFEKMEAETRGGISGRIEFMTVNTTTPYGGSLQYFDEAISGNVWLQIPVTPQVGVRLDARGYVAALRDPHAWEDDSVILPSVRVIWNF